VVLDLQPELIPQPGEATVVVAPLTARVMQPARVRECVCGLVQQRPEHVDGPAVQTFAGNEHLAEGGRTRIGAPAAGCEMAKAKTARTALGARPHGHNRSGHVWVALLDRAPRALERDDQLTTDGLTHKRQ
jgi:hypothetical protein